MGELDTLGKGLMRLAAGELFTADAPSVCFEFGQGAGSARIDGTVAGTVAVEIESRVPKQVRGALLDLVMHPYPAKLLLLIPAHIGNSDTAVAQANVILARFLPTERFRVVCASDDLDDSVRRIRQALIDLGIELACS